MDSKIDRQKLTIDQTALLVFDVDIANEFAATKTTVTARKRRKKKKKKPGENIFVQRTNHLTIAHVAVLPLLYIDRRQVFSLCCAALPTSSTFIK